MVLKYDGYPYAGNIPPWARDAMYAGAMSAASEFGRQGTRWMFPEKNYPMPTSYPDTVNQGAGNRLSTSGKRKRTLKRPNVSKLLRADIHPFEQSLALYRNDNNVPYLKYLTSEFNPGTAGFIPIFQGMARNAAGTNSRTTNHTPMHIYDLSTCLGTTKLDDKDGNFPITSTGQCDNINARAWYWNTDNTWHQLIGNITIGANNPDCQPRWVVIDDKNYTNSSAGISKHVYRKSIDIKMNLYGTYNMPTDYDVRIIRILEKNMCPDYPMTLTDTDYDSAKSTFQQNWQNLVKASCCNPILRGVDPGPKAPRRWFKTVLRKRVSIGEQTGEIENIPAVSCHLHLDLNEVNNYQWDDTGFTLETGDAAYDNVPVHEATDVGFNVNQNPQEKPFYTQRYYLLIRAFCPKNFQNDTSGPDGALGSASGYANLPFFWQASGHSGSVNCPTYDAVIRTFYIGGNYSSGG